MLIPSSVRDDTLSPTQRQELREWLSVHEEHESLEDPLKMALVVSGDKPAMFINSPEEWAFPGARKTDEHFLELIDTLDLGAHQMKEMDGWFVAPGHGRLDLLPSNALQPKNAAWHRRLGVVLGYPLEAIEGFINNDRQTGPRERVKKGDFPPEEIAFVDFVFYRHNDSIDGYEQAIGNGKALRGRFTELAEKWNLPVIDSLAEAFYQRSVAVYSGERKGFPHETVDFKMVARGD